MSIIMHGGDTAGCGSAGEVEVDTPIVNFGGDPEKDPSKGSGQDEICDDPLLQARAGDDEGLNELFEAIGGPRSVLARC